MKLPFKVEVTSLESGNRIIRVSLSLQRQVMVAERDFTPDFLAHARLTAEAGIREALFGRVVEDLERIVSLADVNMNLAARVVAVYLLEDLRVDTVS